MRIAKSGVLLVEHSAKIGPYKLWAADEYECSGCLNKVITIVSSQALVAEWFEDRFAATLERWDPKAIRNNYEKIPS